MSSFPGSPKLVKGGLVILDAGSGAMKRSIALQYNPDTLSRSYQVQGAGGDGETGVSGETGGRVEFFVFRPCTKDWVGEHAIVNTGKRVKAGGRLNFHDSRRELQVDAHLHGHD